MLKRVVLFIFLTLGSLPAMAQDTAWVKRIDDARVDPRNGAGRLLALDMEGNIYVGATGGGGFGFVLAKFNPCGDTLWVKRLGAPNPTALTVDDSGYVYVTGWNLTGTGENFYTVKWKPNGDTAWARIYTGTNTFLDDNPYDIAVDKNRNVIVTGWLSVQGSYADWGTVKYAPNGDTVWVRRYDSGVGNVGDVAKAVAVDTTGNIFVTGFGSLNAASSAEWRTIKYSPSGSVMWSKSHSDSAGSSTNIANDIEVDLLGNAYVCGKSFKLGSGTHISIIKYNPNGDSLWVRRYANPLADSSSEAVALKVDQSGNVYVAGSVDNREMALIKYDSNGNILWDRRYPSAYLASLALDDQGNAFVTGSSLNGDTSLTVKYDPAGDIVWSGVYSHAALGEIDHVAVDTAGNVYVDAEVGSGTDWDVALVKYSDDAPCAVRYTNAGTNVIVSFPPDIFLYFKNVTSPGYTKITYNSTGPAPPGGYTIVPSGSPVYYDIQSTATFTDSVYVCIFYADSVVANEDSLRVLHYNGSAWEDVTFYHDQNTNQICGGSTSLSPFALAEPASCTAIPGDVNASGTITLGDIVHLLNYLFDRNNPPCLGTDPGNCWDFGLTCRGDVNNSASITLGDIVHLLNYVFDRDNPPCLGTDPGNCWTPVASGACCVPVP